MTTPTPDGPRPSDAARLLASGEEIVIDGALFDMDGTLVNSIPAVEYAWGLLADEHGLPRRFSHLHGRTAHAVVAALGIPPQEHDAGVRRLIEIEARPGQELDALPGAAELLGSLPHGLWGVVTSAPRDVAHARYGAAALPQPDFFVTGDDITHGKPDPEPFRRGVDALRERGHAGLVLAFEDTAAGARSARAAGCLAIGVAGTGDGVDLAETAHLVVPSLSHLRVSPGVRPQVSLIP